MVAFWSVVVVVVVVVVAAAAVWSQLSQFFMISLVWMFCECVVWMFCVCVLLYHTCVLCCYFLRIGISYGNCMYVGIAYVMRAF